MGSDRLRKKLILLQWRRCYYTLPVQIVADAQLGKTGAVSFLRLIGRYQRNAAWTWPARGPTETCTMGPRGSVNR